MRQKGGRLHILCEEGLFLSCKLLSGSAVTASYEDLCAADLGPGTTTSPGIMQVDVIEAKIQHLPVLIQRMSCGRHQQ